MNEAMPTAAPAASAPVLELRADLSLERDRRALVFAQADQALQKAEALRAAALRAALTAHVAHLRPPGEACPACGSAAPALPLDEAAIHAELLRTERALALARSDWGQARVALDQACVAHVLSTRSAGESSERRLHS